jgi:excinuclease ABC subunit C
MAQQNPVFDSKSFLGGLTEKPGIYQMLDADGKVLYVGKAKNLNKRVSSYFRNKGLNNKTMALVARIAQMEVTVTRTETEALLLEHNLIKSHRPPYNILLRDDKSYPYIFISAQEFPRIGFHRGTKRANGQYFGPYPNSGAVRESLAFLQKVFRLRQCEDSVFKNRTRPCLQYQINRCSGPCVGLVSKTDYAEDVRHASMFLEGKSQDLLTELGDQMEEAAQNLAFEQAAEYRDQIRSLQRVREVQYIEGESGDLDILAVSKQGATVCMQVMYVRQGRILGSKSYYPQSHLDEAEAQIMAAFIGQFYLAPGAASIPREILVNVEPMDRPTLCEALTECTGSKVAILHRLRGPRTRWVELAATTAEENCRARMANRKNTRGRFEALAEALQLEEVPERLECFDISHSSGENTVASCVVFGLEGPLKSDYRRFNIEGITPGDDYAAMGQALLRRYQRLQKGEGKLPDLLVIDGGKGQMSQAQAVLDELGVTGVVLLGIAKGPTRKAGLEKLYLGADYKELVLQSHDAALHLLQQLRDEAHRFAITGHRGRRDKDRRESTLEKIPGVGPGTRRKLLRYFGGLQPIAAASEEDLVKVSGISAKLARTIYDALHNE